MSTRPYGQQPTQGSIAAPERGIETTGIERIAPETRAHRHIPDNLTMWLSANCGITTLALGSLATTIFGLGFWDSILAILLFNVLGILPVAFFATLGPKLGLRQMTISRFSFGWQGARMMALINAVATLGWCVVDVIVGGQLIASLTNGGVPLPVGIFAIAVITLLVSMYGYRAIHFYQRWAWMPVAVSFLLLTVMAAPRLTIVPTPVLSLTEIASFISFGGAVFGFATGWSSYAADYNVRQPQATPARRIFWYTFLGAALPCILLETLGMTLATALRSASSSTNLLLAAAARPLGSLGTLILVVLALSVIANNIPNAYSMGLSMQVLGKPFQRIDRSVWALAATIIYVLIALPAVANFNETLSNFLLIIAYWLGPWSAILIIEHFIFRKGSYHAEDWDNEKRLPLGWAAVVSFLIGLGGVLLGASQAYYTGPLAHVLGNMDIGFELGIAAAAIAYLLLRRMELKKASRNG